MSADDGIGRKTGKEACIKHGLCAHDGLFRRLENKQDIACKGILCGVEHHRCAKQDGDMHIVAAGVHHAGVFGADRIIGALRHGQRIDIRTDGNGFAGLCTADQADNTRFKPGGKGFDPKAFEGFPNAPCGLKFLHTRFGIFMEGFAQRLQRCTKL